jgi:hypothetical protein
MAEHKRLSVQRLKVLVQGSYVGGVAFLLPMLESSCDSAPLSTQHSTITGIKPENAQSTQALSSVPHLSAVVNWL